MEIIYKYIYGCEEVDGNGCVYMDIGRLLYSRVDGWYSEVDDTEHEVEKEHHLTNPKPQPQSQPQS